MDKLFKQIAREQYSKIVNSAVSALRIRSPKEGWIKTVRMALGMSGAQLSERLGHNRTMAAYLERQELEGGVTLRKMKEAAEALNCHFVYAIVPKESVEGLLEDQALKKAKALVEETHTHMVLEDQGLTKDQLEAETQRLKQQILNNIDRTFWESDERA